MVTGELASVACMPSHAYGGREDAPPPPGGSGLTRDDAVLFEVELQGFEREGHWQVRNLPD